MGDILLSLQEKINHRPVFRTSMVSEIRKKQFQETKTKSKKSEAVHGTS